MGSTRTEQAIDEFDPLADDDLESGCDDIRLAWLADELGGRDGADFDALWSDR
jgi:hypothetical protein